jgi:anti-sigma regulatory factor (Ser/Thr protein kinase)
MVPAASGSIGPLRRQLRRFARAHGASVRVEAAVALAFTEACSPIVRAGDRGNGDPGPLIVEACVEDRELHVRVAHQGRAMGVGPDMEGHGFGLALISHVADRFQISRREDGPGTALAMVFRLET